MLPPAVLWVDPGEMTGLAKYETYNAGFSADELPEEEAWQRIEAMARYYGRRLAIGWERFTITARTHKLTSQPAALETIGVCRYLALAWGCHVLEPAQQHTPDAADRKRLQALGWWVPGKDDAQSAACHMLRWLMSTNELTARQRELIQGR